MSRQLRKTQGVTWHGGRATVDGRLAHRTTPDEHVHHDLVHTVRGKRVRHRNPVQPAWLMVLDESNDPRLKS